MNKSKVSLAVSQIVEKVEKIVGLCWGLLFGLVALVSMFDDVEDGAGTIIIMWIFALLGLMLFNAGKKRTKMRLEFKKYVTQLSIDPSGSLTSLASATGTSVDVVKSNLQYMIKKKFFTDAFINEVANQLVIPSMQRSQQVQVQMAQNVSQGAIQPEWVAFTCPCCGGMNRIQKGTVGECDFCGSPLS